MADDDRPAGGDEPLASALAELSRKLDTVAGAVAAIAGSHTDLLGHVAEAESRRGHDAREVAQRLSAIERQVLALPPPPAVPPDPLDPLPVTTVASDVERLRSDLTLTLEALSQVAHGVRRVDGRLDELAEDLSQHLTRHTDLALAGALRVIDTRLAALRDDLSGGNVGGFEAGAVLGATQAAWTRLEQRLDAEFDDLGRQLQAMVALIERTATIAEAMANRPVVTTEQLRKAASAVKDSVAAAGRSRRERRGGQRGLGPGSAPGT
jgi:hypothetical protein